MKTIRIMIRFMMLVQAASLMAQQAGNIRGIVTDRASGQHEQLCERKRALIAAIRFQPIICPAE